MSEQAHWLRLHESASKEGRRITTVVIGANEGGNETNEWAGRLIRQLGWRAHLIEPSRAVFRRLQSNYAEQMASGTARCHNLAVSSDRNAISKADAGEVIGKCLFLGPTEGCYQGRRSECPFAQREVGVQRGRLVQPPGEHGNAASQKEWQRLTVQLKVEPEHVACVHAADLWVALGLETGEVDVLTVDTEGYDYTIVTALVQEACMRPLSLGFESKYFTKGQVQEIFTLLEANNYRVFDANTVAHSHRKTEMGKRGKLARGREGVPLEMVAFLVPP